MRIRPLLDLGLVILLLLSFAYQLTGSALHELIGGSIFLLAIIHNVLSRRWYTALVKAMPRGRRLISIVVNFLLLAVTALLFSSGIANSHVLFPHAETGPDVLTRQVHAWAAYWFLVLASIHLGMHWTWVTHQLSGAFGLAAPTDRKAMAWRIATLLFVSYGVYATFERSIFLKLIAYYSFDYWDFDRSVTGFFVRYLAIMSVYVFLTYWALRLGKRQVR